MGRVFSHLLESSSLSRALMVRDARRSAPHHEGSTPRHERHLLPSPREAAGGEASKARSRGRGWGGCPQGTPLRRPPPPPPPPPPPRHTRCAWREGSSRPHPFPGPLYLSSLRGAKRRSDP